MSHHLYLIEVECHQLGYSVHQIKSNDSHILRRTHKWMAWTCHIDQITGIIINSFGVFSPSNAYLPISRFSQFQISKQPLMLWLNLFIYLFSPSLNLFIFYFYLLKLWSNSYQKGAFNSIKDWLIRGTNPTVHYWVRSPHWFLRYRLLSSTQQ